MANIGYYIDDLALGLSITNSLDNFSPLFGAT